MEVKVHSQSTSQPPAYGLNPLRRARQARGLSLEDVARETRLSPRILSTIELGHFEALPSGLFARAQVAAYARAVGLDSQEVLERLADRLPGASDPLEALRARESRRWHDAHPFFELAGSLARRLAARIGAWRSTPGPIRTHGRRWQLRHPGPADVVVLLALSAGLVVGAAVLTNTSVVLLLRTQSTPLVAAIALVALHYLLVSSGAAFHFPWSRTRPQSGRRPIAAPRPSPWAPVSDGRPLWRLRAWLASRRET
jgi:transcriptional regulator with XRE-family HTH domain